MSHQNCQDLPTQNRGPTFSDLCVAGFHAQQITQGTCHLRRVLPWILPWLPSPGIPTPHRPGGSAARRHGGTAASRRASAASTWQSNVTMTTTHNRPQPTTNQHQHQATSTNHTRLRNWLVLFCICWFWLMCSLKHGSIANIAQNGPVKISTMIINKGILFFGMFTFHTKPRTHGHISVPYERERERVQCAMSFCHLRT